MGSNYFSPIFAMARKLNRRSNLRLEKESRFVSATETKLKASCIGTAEIKFPCDRCLFIWSFFSCKWGTHLCLFKPSYSAVLCRLARVKRVVYHWLLGSSKEINQSFSKLSQLQFLTKKTPALINKFKTVSETNVAKRRTSSG